MGKYEQSIVMVMTPFLQKDNNINKSTNSNSCFYYFRYFLSLLTNTHYLGAQLIQGKLYSLMTDTPYITKEFILGLEGSFFERKEAKAKHPLTICRILNGIRSDYYKKDVLSIRQLLSLSENKRASNIKNNLNAVTFSATFPNERKANNYEIYNFLLVIDIDHLSEDDIKKTEHVLENDKYIFSYWLSPSGKGYKGLVPISFDLCKRDLIPMYHKQCYVHLTDYFRKQYDIELDPSGKDLSRLCFFSYCPELRIKDGAHTFFCDIKTTTEVVKTNSEIDISKPLAGVKFQGVSNSQECRNVMNKIIKYLEKKNISITSSYDNWTKVAFAIASTFPLEVGTKYFMRLCRLDGINYNDILCEKLINDAYKTNIYTADFGTIIYLAKRVGFIYTPKVNSKD